MTDLSEWVKAMTREEQEAFLLWLADNRPGTVRNAKREWWWETGQPKSLDS